MQTIKDVTNYLKAWRLQNTSMRQEDVGVKANLSKQHYQRIESGSDLKLNTLLAVLDVLGLEIRLVPKRKRVKTSSEIDHLVTEARKKVALNFQHPHDSSDKVSLAEFGLQYSDEDKSDSTSNALINKQKHLESVFGSSLNKRRKMRAEHVLESVTNHTASSAISRSEEQKERGENDKA